jgi:uncharacterized protein YxjI
LGALEWRTVCRLKTCDTADYKSALHVRDADYNRGGLLYMTRRARIARMKTMRYVMKQKLFCWGDDFAIKDESGADRFFVDGKAFTIGEKLSFQDMNGNELAFIRQKLLAWGPTYEIYRNGELAAVVKKQLFTFFNCRFTVDVPGPDDLEAGGDFTDHEYTFARRGACVAAVSKRWFSWTDTYGVDINPGEDDVLVLASTVVIDMACHGDNKRR